MAVKVRRTFRGETSRTADDGKEETWYFDVETDSLSYTVTQAKTAVDSADPTNPLKFIPAKGKVHPEDSELICQDIQADRDADLPTLIRVAVQWRSLRNNGSDGATGGDSSDGSSSPATPVWNIELAFDREAYTYPRNVDFDGLVLRNVNGDPLEPYEAKSSDAVYLYSFYVKNLDWVAMGAAHGKVNMNEVVLTYNGQSKTFARRTLMIEPKFNPVQTLEPAVEGAGKDIIYKVECRLVHREDGYFPKLLNQGLREKKSDGKLYHIQGEDGQPISSPVALDADGKKLADGQPLVYLPLPAEGETDSAGFRLVKVLEFSELPGFGG